MSCAAAMAAVLGAELGTDLSTLLKVIHLFRAVAWLHRTPASRGVLADKIVCALPAPLGATAERDHSPACCAGIHKDCTVAATPGPVQCSGSLAVRAHVISTQS